MTRYHNDILNGLKGGAMGAANVIPGVSGGTVAFITGIYERLINAIKSLDLNAIRLLLKLKFSDFAVRADFRFLITVIIGALISVLSLARLLDFFFVHYPVMTWSFFFGLIVASIFGVGKMINVWNITAIISMLMGVGIAVCILFVPHSTGSTDYFYLILCGVAAISSMIVPGVSGSFVLLVMGNYELVLKAINEWNFSVLVPFMIGCIIGLVSLSHLISWVFRRYRNVTLSLITGFIIGSLLLIWPWKQEVLLTDNSGHYSVKVGDGLIEHRSGDLETIREELKEGEEFIVIGYSDWHFPSLLEFSSILAILFALLGAMLVFFIDLKGKGTSKKNEKAH
ncbi:MAG: DUF368 domain-containing protein [Verrucomicrobiota bacterium]|nr:DUF368 domain-containing protein [Verrucomicrobiota bacterium]